MNKFETIERDLIEFKLRFSHWTPERMLNIQEESNTLDMLLESNKNDKDAFELIKNIEKDLEGYFLNINNKINFELIETNSLKRYHKKMNSIKSNYLQLQVNEQINILNLSIIEERNKHPIFIEIFSNSDYSINTDEFKKLLSEKSAELYLKFNYSSTHTILKIHNYNLDLSNFVTSNTVFNKLKEPIKNLTTSPIQRFKDLFNQDKECGKIIKLLTEKEFITKNLSNEEESFNWKAIRNDTTLKPLKLLCTLVVVLDIKNYLKPNLKNNKIASILTNTFPGYTVSPEYYGKVNKDIRLRIDNTKDSDYYDSYHFIP